MSNLSASDEWRTFYLQEGGLIPSLAKRLFEVPNGRSEQHAEDVKRAVLLSLLPRFL